MKGKEGSIDSVLARDFLENFGVANSSHEFEGVLVNLAYWKLRVFIVDGLDAVLYLGQLLQLDKPIFASNLCEALSIAPIISRFLLEDFLKFIICVLVGTKSSLLVLAVCPVSTPLGEQDEHSSNLFLDNLHLVKDISGIKTSFDLYLYHIHAKGVISVLLIVGNLEIALHMLGRLLLLDALLVLGVHFEHLDVLLVVLLVVVRSFRELYTVKDGGLGSSPSSLLNVRVSSCLLQGFTKGIAAKSLSQLVGGLVNLVLLVDIAKVS